MNMSRRRFLEAGILGGAMALLPRSAQPEVLRPNLLVILVDDLGAEAFGCYGGTSYETPQVDALAAGGVRFENCYASPTCIPSRVTALTGRYPFRSGLDEPLSFRDDTQLDPDTPTFATRLRDVGYRTAVAGKWQLARLDLHPDHPERCGFDESFLWAWTKDGKSRARRYWGAEIFENGRLRAADTEEYGPDRYCDFLVDFIERCQHEPFLAFYPMTLVHSPFLPTPEDGTLAWLASYGIGRDVLSEPFVARFLAASAFRSMVGYADALVGRLVSTLDRLGLRERTVVLLTADNGTPKPFTSMLGDRKISGGKDSLTEAGTRVPFIGSWPSRVVPGTADDLVDLSDLLPTLAELGGARPSSVPLDGVSLAPRLLRAKPSPRVAAFAQRSERWFVRDRRWRYHHDGRLYDLRDRYSERLADPGPAAEAARARLAAASPILRGQTAPSRAGSS